MFEGGAALKKGLEEVFGGRRGGLEEDGGGPTDGGRPAGRGGVDGRTGLGAGRLVGLGGRKMLSMKDKKLGRSSWGEALLSLGELLVREEEEEDTELGWRIASSGVNMSSRRIAERGRLRINEKKD